MFETKSLLYPGLSSNSKCSPGWPGTRGPPASVSPRAGITDERHQARPDETWSMKKAWAPSGPLASRNTMLRCPRSAAAGVGFVDCALGSCAGPGPACGQPARPFLIFFIFSTVEGAGLGWCRGDKTPQISVELKTTVTPLACAVTVSQSPCDEAPRVHCHSEKAILSFGLGSWWCWVWTQGFAR